MNANTSDMKYDGNIPVPRPKMVRQSPTLPGNACSVAEMLIEEIINVATGDINRDIPEWLRIWKDLTHMELPHPVIVRNTFAQTLTQESDLAPSQIEEIMRWLFSVENKPYGGAEECLMYALERFHLMIRPWFPVWRSYVSWVINWCIVNSYTQIKFLCRDAVPFYVIGNRQFASLENGSMLFPVKLGLLHASRRLMRSQNFDKYYISAVSETGPIAFVDSGCYGSLIPDLARRAKICGDEKHTPAVFFFFSRNAQLFGYMNYLASWEMLAGQRVGNEDYSLADFVILAGDVIETLPKPYKVVGFSATGAPILRLQDAATFVFGAWLLAELDRTSRLTIDPRRQRDEAYAAVLSLWSMFASSRDNDQIPGLLFRSPAPKCAPMSDDYRHLWGIPPQDMMFGISVG